MKRHLFVIAVLIVAISGCQNERSLTEKDGNQSRMPVASTIENDIPASEIDLGLRRVPTDGYYIIFDKEPTSLRIRPTDSCLTVPAARVKQKLLAMQLASFETTNHFIVRFEVVHFEPKILPSLYSENALELDGLRAIALLYRAELKEGSVPLSGRAVKLYDPPSKDSIAGRSISPQLDQLTIDVTEVELSPVGTARLEEDDGRLFILGTHDWKVIKVTKLSSTSADSLLRGLPILDPSAVELLD